MALSESRLTTKIEDLIDECRLDEGDASIAKQKFANLLAKAIVEEIKLADVTGLCPQDAGALTQGKIN